MSLRTAITALSLSLLVSLPAAAELKATGESKVNFRAVGPAGFKIDGKGKDLSLEDDGEKLKVIVPLKDLDTGIELRNRHMTEKYLEVAKYPNAELTIPWKAIEKPADGATKEGKAKGTMAIHGKTQEVPFTYRVSRKGEVYSVKGEVPVNIKDYDIKIPSYLGVTVKPNVDVSVEFDAKES